MKYTHDQHLLPVSMGPSDPQPNLDGVSTITEDGCGSIALDVFDVKKETFPVLEEGSNVKKEPQNAHTATPNVIKETVEQTQKADSETEISDIDNSNIDITEETLMKDHERKRNKCTTTLPSEKIGGNHPDPLCCHICEFTSSGRKKSGMMAKHLFKVHGHQNKKLFPCKKCNKMFTRKTYLNNHICSAGLTCLNCHETFADKPSLQKHRVTQCYKFKAICNICGFKTTKKTALRRHMLNVHKEIEKDVFVCETCNLPFASKSLFEKHKEKHRTSGFSCTKCSHSFPDWKTLNHHKRMIHLKFYCKQCPATFALDYKLRVRRHDMRDLYTHQKL